MSFTRSIPDNFARGFKETGHRYEIVGSKWFTKEFGSTLCREVTQCDFSSSENVHRYIGKYPVATCKIIAEKVAKQAEMIIKTIETE